MNGTEMIGMAVMHGDKLLLIEMPKDVFDALVVEGERQCREESESVASVNEKEKAG